MAGGPTPYEAEREKVEKLAALLLSIYEASDHSDTLLYSAVRAAEVESGFDREMLRALAGRNG